MSIIAWIVLGALAGYLAGLLVRDDESPGIAGHVVLGVFGALIGGFLAGAIFDTNPIEGSLEVASLVTSLVGAVVAVMVVGALLGRSRTGRGAV